MIQQSHSWAYIQKRQKALFRKDTCTPMFTGALFTIPKTWKQPQGPSTNEWIKMWCVCVCIYIYVLYWNILIVLQWNIIQPLKRMKSCHLQQCEWTLRALC